MAELLIAVHGNFRRCNFLSSLRRQYIDAHPSVLKWASEPIKIPYYNPFYKFNGQTGRNTYYIPDFFIAYQDRNGTIHQELVEIKPEREDPRNRPKIARSRNKLLEAKQALNMLKWQAAIQYCKARNWTFRVMTEVDLFGYKRAG